MTYQHVGFILWDGEPVRTGDGAIRIYSKESVAGRVSTLMGIPYRPVFINVGEPEVFDAPKPEPRKLDVEWCKKQLAVAEHHLFEDRFPENEDLRKAVGGIVTVLHEMLRPT